MTLNRAMRKAMKKVGAAKCYLTGLRSMTSHGILFDSKNPQWTHAPFEDYILAQGEPSDLPPEWEEVKQAKNLRP